MARYPDLDSLALLADVAGTGSLSRSAAHHGLRQPSASARIAALERRLGVQLLIRSTRGSELTPAGRLVVEWTTPLLSAANELSQGVAALRRRRSAQLTVAASLTIAEYLLPEWLVRLHDDDPSIAVQLTVANSSDVIATVLNGRVPLGFVECPTVPTTLAARSVGGDRLVVVVAPSHPWASRSRVEMTELLATPLLMREPGSGTRQALEYAVAHAGRLAPAALQLSTTTAIRSAAASGSAPAVLSELTVAADVAARRLVAIDVTGFEARRRLRAVWRRGTDPGGAARALVMLAAGGARRGGSPSPPARRVV